MNPLDPAYSLNVDGENNYADPEECSEDSDNDEDYSSFQRPAFLLEGEPDFDSSPPENGLEYLHKAIAPRPSGRGQGLSQKATAVAVLSSVLTAETKKRSPDASPARSSRNPPLPESSPSVGTKSKLSVSETKDSQEVSDVNGNEELTKGVVQHMHFLQIMHGRHHKGCHNYE